MADSVNKILWIERITFDLGLSPASVRTALAIVCHLNRKDGYARPSIPCLATETGVSENTVRSAIKALVERGYLLVEDGGGRHRANRYRISFPDLDGARPRDKDDEQKPSSGLQGIEREKGFIGLQGIDEKPCSALQGIAEKPFNPRAETLQNGGQKPFSRLNPNPYIEPIIEPDKNIYGPSKAPKPLKREVDDERFTEFWAVYPRKVAKADALKAWTSALKRTDPATLIAGAMRYAAERTGQDSTYTKHPATWLNKGCWTDEPAAPQQPTVLSQAHSRNGMSAKERTGAAIRAMLASIPEEDLQ